MTPATTPALTLNNAVTMPALGPDPETLSPETAKVVDNA